MKLLSLALFCCLFSPMSVFADMVLVRGSAPSFFDSGSCFWYTGAQSNRLQFLNQTFNRPSRTFEINSFGHPNAFLESGDPDCNASEIDLYTFEGSAAALKNLEVMQPFKVNDGHSIVEYSMIDSISSVQYTYGLQQAFNCYHDPACKYQVATELKGVLVRQVASISAESDFIESVCGKYVGRAPLKAALKGTTSESAADGLIDSSDNSPGYLLYLTIDKQLNLANVDQTFLESKTILCGRPEAQ